MLPHSYFSYVNDNTANPAHRRDVGISTPDTHSTMRMYQRLANVDSCLTAELSTRNAMLVNHASQQNILQHPTMHLPVPSSTSPSVLHNKILGPRVHAHCPATCTVAPHLARHCPSNTPLFLVRSGRRTFHHTAAKVTDFHSLQSRRNCSNGSQTTTTGLLHLTA